MDQILVDVTSLPVDNAGDEAVLIGEQGSESIFARELADQAGTISWDIFTGIGTARTDFIVEIRATLNGRKGRRPSAGGPSLAAGWDAYTNAEAKFGDESSDLLKKSSARLA